jgi:hypothetical protein
VERIGALEDKVLSVGTDQLSVSLGQFHRGLILPAYTSNNGLTDGWALMEVIHDLRARGGLREAEQVEVEPLVPVVEQMVYRSSRRRYEDSSRSPVMSVVRASA